jgi:preprotein translocase subunit YajC
MFVSPAFAQAGAEASGPGALQAFLPIILIFVVFYFLLIRPQQKKMKQHKEMLAAVRRGDRVVTGGGIVGLVTKVIDDNEVQVEIADGVRVRVQRALLSNVVAKTEPAPPSKDSPPPSDKTTDPALPEATGSRVKRLFGGKSE